MRRTGFEAEVWLGLVLAAGGPLCGRAGAQAGGGAETQRTARAMGTVATADANVSGVGGRAFAVSGGRAVLVGSGTVTAKDRTAEVALTRGGEVRVCQTSGLHMTEAGQGDASLLLALDRGAVEIRMRAMRTDIIMTPDLRMVAESEGALDLRMRVTRNGDTCMENRGHGAPVLHLTDAFGEAVYLLKPGQHVLFEHGSLQEVVDRETTPCGCPPDDAKRAPGGSIAEAVLAGGGSVTPKQAEVAHPFPDAVSAGLAEPGPVPPETPGGTHVQVASAMTYDPAAKRPAVGSDGLSRDPASAGDSAESGSSVAHAEVRLTAEAPVATGAAGVGAAAGAHRAEKQDVLHVVGRFFKHIFVR